MVPVKLAVAVSAVGEVESVTRIVKETFPAWVGVPVMAPVVEFSDNPAGNWPEAIDHVYGVVPPEADNWAL